MTHVWHNKVVLRHGMVGQISRQLVIRPDVRYAFGRVGVRGTTSDVGEIHKWEMFDVEKAEVYRAGVEDRAAKVWLRVGSPRNTRISEEASPNVWR